MAKKGYITGVGSRFDGFMTACDIIGMSEIPVVSQGADLISGVGSLLTGDFVGAGLSVAGLIPGVGQVTGSAKMARRTAKIIDAASDSKKTTGTAMQSAKLLELTGPLKRTDTIKTSPQLTKRATEIDAKPTKKEVVKEKENIDRREANTIQEPDINQDFNISPSKQKGNFEDLTPMDQWEIQSNNIFENAVKNDNSSHLNIFTRANHIESTAPSITTPTKSNIISKPIKSNMANEYNKYIAKKNAIEGYKKF